MSKRSGTEVENEMLDLDGGIQQPTATVAATKAVEVEAETPEAETPAGVERDVDGVPYCIKHHCRMRQYSGRKKDRAAAHYVCKVPGCNETAKIVRIGQKSVPAEPMECPNCAKQGQQVFLERMPPKKSKPNPTSVRLWCPVCELTVGPLALPNQAAAHALQMRRAAVGTIGER